MSRRGHINCSEPKRNYVTRYKLALLGQVAGGGGGHTLTPFIGLHKFNNRVEKEEDKLQGKVRTSRHF